jgi:5-methylcytosine-specific restriction endonuclease McrA
MVSGYTKEKKKFEKYNDYVDFLGVDKGNKMEAHHIIPRSEGGTDNEENIVSLRRDAHRGKTGYSWQPSIHHVYLDENLKNETQNSLRKNRKLTKYY